MKSYSAKGELKCSQLLVGVVSDHEELPPSPGTKHPSDLVLESHLTENIPIDLS